MTSQTLNFFNTLSLHFASAVNFVILFILFVYIRISLCILPHFLDFSDTDLCGASRLQLQALCAAMEALIFIESDAVLVYEKDGIPKMTLLMFLPASFFSSIVRFSIIHRFWWTVVDCIAMMSQVILPMYHNMLNVSIQVCLVKT